MPKKGDQIGVESPELGGMNKPLMGFLIAALLLASLSALWLLSLRTTRPAFQRPTERASDFFDVWEHPGAWPTGLKVADSVHAELTCFTRSVDSMSVWFVPSEPLALPPGFESQPSYGGWLIGKDVSIWEEGPGEMAAHWHPRTHGTTRLAQLATGRLISMHAAVAGEPAQFQTEWCQPAPAALTYSTLPSAWRSWCFALERQGKCKKIAAGAFPLEGAAWLDSVGGLAQAAWLEVELDGGGVLVALAGDDSLATEAAGGHWADGVGYHSLAEAGENWDSMVTLDQGPEDGTGPMHPTDFIRIEAGQRWEGRWGQGSRIVWQLSNYSATPNLIAGSATGARNEARTGTPAATTTETSIPTSATGVPLGTARNHRTGTSMELVWNASHVEAWSDEVLIWKWPVESLVPPAVWEVDLYRNGKYQVAIGAGKRFDLVDVLGRSVAGFPKRWSEGFSAFGVFDYDRNRKFRFLLATPSGELFNFREEGERTPGWKFERRAGRHIVTLAHLRIGPSDYIYAGQDDGSMRFLQRTGEDRFESRVVLPVVQQPAFRLGATLAESTVLYIDAAGQLQEQVLGTGKFTGLSGFTQGTAVAVVDLDEDGIPEVVVQTPSGEVVYNARNEKLNP